MTDVFISYSRRDKVFTQKLVSALSAAKREVWADWESIPAASDWDAEIKEGIEKTNTVLFLLSPEWIKSNECYKEMVHAIQMGKRLVPILHIMPAQGQEVPPELAKLNWVYMRETDDFDKAFETLQGAMDTDLDWVKTHTRIQVRAIEWNKKNRDNSLTLRGNDLTEGEQFISHGTHKSPEPTELQGEFILTSRKDATRRQRITLAGVTIALVVSVALGIIAIFQRQAAVLNSKISFSRELAASSKNNLDSDPELSILLALEATNTLKDASQPILQSVEEALREAVQTNRIRYIDDQEYNNDNILSSAISPNGTQLVTGSWNGKVVIWKITEGTMPVAETGYSTNTVYLEPELQLKEQFEPIYSISFSPDGEKFATSSSSSAIEPAVWDAKTGEKLFTLSGHGEHVRSIVFSPNGTYLATASEDGTARIWDANTGKELLVIKDHIHETIEYSDFNYVYDVAFSPDSSAVASVGGDRIVLISDVNTGAVLNNITAEGVIFTVAFNPDGSSIVWGDDRNLVITADLASGQENVTNVHNAQVYDLIFSPDGKHLASTGADGKIAIVDKSNSSLPIFLSRNPSITSTINSISYTPDGRYIISGNINGELIVWDSASTGYYEINSINAHDNPITGLSFSPDGTSFATSGTNSANIWSMPDENLLQTFTQGTIEDIHFLLDGQKVLIGAGWDGAGIWDINTGSKDTDSNFIQFSDAYVLSSAVGADGKLVATSQIFSNADDSDIMPLVTAWDVNQGIKLQEIEFTRRGVFGVALSPDGKYLAAGGEDGTIRILNLESNKTPRTLTGHENWVRSINFSPDGKRLITGSFDNTAIVWDVESGDKVFTLLHHNASINDAVFSPDGTMIALASSDGTATIWDTATGTLRYSLSPHAGNINNLAFSPDNKVIALGAEDGGVRFYFTNIEDVITLAGIRLPRTLTIEECQVYMHIDACPDGTITPFEISKENITPLVIKNSTPESIIPKAEGLKSGSDSVEVILNFANKTDKAIKLTWMNFEGVEEAFYDLAPGETLEQGTISNHAWRLRDSSGNLIFEYTATDQPVQEITIDADLTVTIK